MSDESFWRFLLVGLALAVVVDVLTVAIAGWVACAIAVANAAFLGLALIVSRNERQASETVTVDGRGVLVARRSASGRECERHMLPLALLSLRREDNDQFGCRSIQLHSGGRILEIGAALAPDERASFFDALLDALRDAGCTPRIERVSQIGHLARHEST